MDVTLRAPFQPKRTQAQPGRLLAIDYGLRRIGLAVSDALGVMSRPLATLERRNRREDMKRLREIARKHEVRKILVGFPMHLDGRASEMAAEAERFAARVAKELNLPVELVDERLTSWEAKQLLMEKQRSSRRQSSLDAIAAAILLRDYLAKLPPEIRRRWQGEG